MMLKIENSSELFEKLFNLIMRDFSRYEVVETQDRRFFKIRFVVGADCYVVEFFDYRPVEIIYQEKRMNQGHEGYPWLRAGHGRRPAPAMVGGL